MRWYDRLRGAREIVSVRRRGTRYELDGFAVYFMAAGSGGSRVAFTVSKAVGPAVVRNLVRRRLKGALDGAAPLAAPRRVLFVVKPGAARLSFLQLAADVAVALERLRRS